jgi:hypothetical protein
MAERRSINHVRIALDRGTVTVPWASREALLDQFRQLESMREVREAFVAVGLPRALRGCPLVLAALKRKGGEALPDRHLRAGEVVGSP